MRHLLSVSFALFAAAAVLAAQSGVPASAPSNAKPNSQSIEPGANATALAPMPQAKSPNATLDSNASRVRFFRVEPFPQSSPACPFPISARQGSGAGLIAVRPGQPDEGPRPGVSQRIQLSVTDSRSIAEASVVVHGTTAAGRMMPLGDSAGPSQISRPLNVTFSSGGKNQENADLRLRGFTSVSSIDVQSVTYADGTVWRSMAGACRVVPDPVMRIAAR